MNTRALPLRLAERRRAMFEALGAAVGVSAGLAAALGVIAAFTGSVGVAAAATDRLMDLTVHAAALFGAWFATRPPDPRHPYGYDRYETLTSMAIGMLLLGTVGLIAWGSVERIRDPEEVSSIFAGMTAMGLASAVSFGLASFMKRRAERIGSDVVMSESSHAWADGMMNGAVVAGLAVGALGFPRVDPLIGLAVAGLVAWRAFAVVLDSARLLADAAVVDEADVLRIARAVPGVVDCHAIRSRGGAGRVRIDLHIHVPGTLAVREAHAVAVQVDKAIRQEIPGIAEVFVHVGPGD